jgi:hypothetical protein
MKKLLFFPIFILFLAACSNDFEVTAPWKEVPIVYGLLSTTDTAHYIRIEKAFLDPEESALKIAKIADSLYYPADAIQAYIEEKGKPQSRIQLSRVDGVAEGIVRAEGIFATQPSWLYKFKLNGNDTLIPGKTYFLTIERKDGKPAITAETVIPRNFQLVSPQPFSPNSKLGISSTSNDRAVDIRNDEFGALFNLNVLIRYRDETANGTVIAQHEILWEAAKNVSRGAAVGTPVGGVQNYRTSFPLSRSTFHKLLVDNIPPAASGVFRRFGSFDLFIEGGGVEIVRAIEANNINSGLTGAEVTVNYTNISEGYGIFTAKNTLKASGIILTQATVDTMNVYPATRALNFY